MNHLNPIDEASDPETPFQRLPQLSYHDDVEVRRALVDNPSIAVDENGEVTKTILLRLAKEFPDDVAACSTFALFGLELKEQVMLDVVDVLAEKAKDPGVLTILLNEFGPDLFDIRWSIARNPSTPQELLRFMANKNNEHDPEVRVGVAKNPSTPPDILRFMANETNEPDMYVRECVASNPSTPEDVLRFLADKNNEPDSHARISAYEALKKRGLQ